jgi:tRNA pseudouridine55 synthase
LPPEGVLVVDKPRGMTSRSVVSSVCRILDAEKGGHAGTLDPIATGVLVICLGRATLLSGYISGGKKVYEVEGLMGIRTDTFDTDGNTLESECTENLDLSELQVEIEKIHGLIEQKPPIYSAVKYKGKPLYYHARRGHEVEIPTREVEVEKMGLRYYYRSGGKRYFGLEITCGPGTYVRSIVSDLGDALGCGAAVSKLRRTKSGYFKIENAVPFNLIELNEPGGLNILTMEEATAFMRAVNIYKDAEWHVRCGKPLKKDWIVEDLPDALTGGVFRVLSEDGLLLALYNKPRIEDEDDIVGRAQRVIRP